MAAATLSRDELFDIAARASTLDERFAGDYVPIAEAEQFYIALRDVGTDAVMIRYPREGHGVREALHQVDWINRSIRWYEKYFPK